MHALTRHAHHAAWYTEDDHDGRAYDVFRRLNRRPRRRPVRQGDGEGGNLHHMSTENDAPDPVSDRRRMSFQNDSSDFGLQRSHSFPGLPYSSSYEQAAPEEFSGPLKAGLSSVVEKGMPPTSSVETPETKDAEVGESTMRRKRDRFMPWSGNSKSHETDDDETSAADPKTRAPTITVVEQLKVIFAAWVNILLCFVPAGFAVYYTHQSAATIFVVNFFAIIPLGLVLQFSLEELSLYIGDVLGGILNTSSSNMVQLISSIFLLKARQIQVLRSSLLGSILQSMLLMTGFAFFFGGIQRQEQYFNVTIAQTMGMFLLLAILSLTIPTVSRLLGSATENGIKSQSYGTAIVIIVSYLLWLTFQFWTHRMMFEEPTQPYKKRPKKMADNTPIQELAIEEEIEREKEEEETPRLSRIAAIITIIASTTLLAFNAEFASNSVQGVMEQHHLSTTFMGIVILPLLSNDMSAIGCAIRDKLDLSLALTIHRSMQTSLLVVPLVVMIAWGMGADEMTLDFDGFSVAATFGSVLIVNYVIVEGKSNWLTGALLIKTFVIIGLASFYIE